MSKPSSTILGAALLAAISLAASRGDAADGCIPASVVAALADCSAAGSAPATPASDVLAAAAQLQSRAGGGQLPGGYGKAACEAKSPSCVQMEEVLYNAARAYQGARDIDRNAPIDVQVQAHGLLGRTLEALHQHPAAAVEQIRSMPLPKDWKRAGPGPRGSSSEEIATRFRTALGEATASTLSRAKAASVSCLSYSVKYRWFDAHARGCSSWLSRWFSAEYPRIDEIHDRPSHRFFALDRELPIGGLRLAP